MAQNRGARQGVHAALIGREAFPADRRRFRPGQAEMMQEIRVSAR